MNKIQTLLRTRLARAASIAGVGHGARAVIALLTSILTVRYLGADLFGTLQFIVAALAIFPVFYASLDYTIDRFFYLGDQEKRAEILLAVLSVKGLILGVLMLAGGIAAVAVMPWWKSPLAEAAGESAIVIITVILLVRLPLDLLVQTLTRLLIALQQFTALTKLQVAVPSLTLAWVGIVALGWRDDVETGIIAIVGGYWLSSFIFLVVAARLTRKHWPEGLGRSLIRETSVGQAIRGTFGQGVRRYVLPLYGQSLVGYVKQYLPNLVIGALTSMQDVALYKVIEQVYSYVHKFVPSLLRFIFPGMHAAYVRDRRAFEKHYRTASLGYLMATTTLAFSLVVFNEPVLSLWGLEVWEPTAWLFVIFSVDLVLGTLIQIETQCFLFGHDNRILMVLATARGVISGLLVAVLVRAFGLVGAPMARLAGTLIFLVGISGATWRSGVRNSTDIARNMRLGAVSAAALLLCGILLGR